MSIDHWRRRINELDSELLQLLNERARIAVKAGESKKEAGVSLCDHTREREVIERMCGVNEGPLDDRAIVELYRAIIHESRRIQQRQEASAAPALRHDLKVTQQLRVAFQGARGAFSEAAALKLLGNEIDFHPEPARALVDGPQALLPHELPIFLEDVPSCAKLTSSVAGW